MEKKLRMQQFTLDDFLDQMDQLKKMGPLDQIIGMLPGVTPKIMNNLQFDEKKIVNIEAIIKSMTKQERNTPSIINSSRKKRIAAGSGTTVQDINKLLRDFENMKKMIKSLDNTGRGGKKNLRGFRIPF